MPTTTRDDVVVVDTVRPITSDDRVIARGRYLVYESDPTRRFSLRGIAFPVAPYMYRHPSQFYDADGWIAVLRQLRSYASAAALNAVRLYELHDVDKIDYSEFFLEAARLGFYVLVPLTSSIGDGVLNRDRPAPDCYNETLYRYGTFVLDRILLNASYPNVIGGVVGNEVMNSIRAWRSAPCILAYARDLKRYAAAAIEKERQRPPHRRQPQQRRQQSSGDDSGHYSDNNICLIYTAQHDGIGAALSPAETVQLTLEYMSACGGSSDDDLIGDATSDDSGGGNGNGNGNGGNSVIDLFGINVESWCSSTQTFERNDDNSTGTYADLFWHMENATTAIIFSETGCSKQLFNRDNGLERYVRDWKQLSVILGPEMNSRWSGFVAYAYDGPPYFRMMADGPPWDGVHPLSLESQDAKNFLSELEKTAQDSNTDGTLVESGGAVSKPTVKCSKVLSDFKKCCELTLLPVDQVPSYYTEAGTPRYSIVAFQNKPTTASHVMLWMLLAGVVIATVLTTWFWRQRCGGQRHRYYRIFQSDAATTTYDTFQYEQDTGASS